VLFRSWKLTIRFRRRRRKLKIMKLEWL